MDVVADIEELYQQLLSTRIYYQKKLGHEIPTNQCRLCNTKPETVAHVLTGCPRYSGYEIEQINVIVDALGGYSEGVRSSLVRYLGKSIEQVKVLNKIQRAVLFGSIRMKNLFKSIVNATA